MIILREQQEEIDEYAVVGPVKRQEMRERRGIVGMSTLVAAFDRIDAEQRKEQ
jgi:hypothetical protein